MKNYKLVLPEHLNHYGFLFGGHLLKWVDEMAYIAANIDFPGNDFVTISMDDVLFKHSIRNGDILCFSTVRRKLGNTSVSYSVKVYRENETEEEGTVLFETNMTFVSIDQEGKKQMIVR
ncbi:MAG TPA: acyl-CoA thioesterase [Gammaproteobacteria bacterium]|nr:acyl-CoA thioesterase [Gammaproteobacteria bacterium]